MHAAVRATLVAGLVAWVLSSEAVLAWHEAPPAPPAAAPPAAKPKAEEAQPADDAARRQAEDARRNDEDAKRQSAEAEKKQEAEKKLEEEKKRQAAEEKKKKQEEAEKKQEEEKKRQAAEEEKKKQEEAEKKKQEDEKKRKAAEEKKRQDDERRRQEERAYLNQLDLLREQEAKRPRTAHEKNHDAVRKAFTESVQAARAATVTVLADGVPAALGAVVAEDGLVLTKASELRGAIEVRFSDGAKLPAQVLGVSDPHDLGLLKIERTGLTPIAWAETAPDLGSWLATPGPSEVPLAIGVVSVAPRSLRPRGMLGVALKMDADRALIEQVVPDSPAAKAGLKANDVITQVEGQIVATSQKLMELLLSKSPGEKVQLHFKRGDEEKEAVATLMAPPSLPQDRLSRFNRMNELGGGLSGRRGNFPAALQHDTVLKPEECGGPLVDLDGKAVGVNIARSGRIDSYALPASEVLPAIEALRSGKLAPSPQFAQGLKLKAVDFQLGEHERLLRAAEREKALAERRIADAQKKIDDARKRRSEIEKQPPAPAPDKNASR